MTSSPRSSRRNPRRVGSVSVHDPSATPRSASRSSAAAGGQVSSRRLPPASALLPRPAYETGDHLGPPLPKEMAAKLDALTDLEWGVLKGWLTSRFQKELDSRGWTIVSTDWLKRKGLL